MTTKSKSEMSLILLICIIMSFSFLSVFIPKASGNYPTSFTCVAGNISHNITIDGMHTDNEWDYLQANLITFDFINKVAIGSIQFAWDLNYLYVMASILDVNQSSDCGFLIFFDEAHDGILNAFEDVRGLFSNNTKMNKHVNASYDLEIDANEADYHAIYGYNSTINSHWFEMAIPFSDLGVDFNITPSIGLTIGIDLEYWNGTHFDDYPDLGRQTVVWEHQTHYGDLLIYGDIFNYDFTDLIINLIIVSIIIAVLIGTVIAIKIYAMKKEIKIKDKKLALAKGNKDSKKNTLTDLPE